MAETFTATDRYDGFADAYAGGSSFTRTISGVDTTASTDATFTLIANGDFDGDNNDYYANGYSGFGDSAEWLRVQVEGVDLGYFLNRNDSDDQFSGSDYGSWNGANSGTATISQAQWQQIVADGQITITYTLGSHVDNYQEGYSGHANYYGYRPAPNYGYGYYGQQNYSEYLQASFTYGVNNPPVAQPDSYAVTEENTLTVAAAEGVLANDSDVEGDGFTAVLASNPANGTVTLNADGSFVYTPNENFFGTDSFTYRPRDGGDGEDATVTIEVAGTQDAPRAVEDSYSFTEDQTLTVAASGVLGNDSDPDRDAISAYLVEGPRNGALTLNADGSFTYAPNANFEGADSFTYRAQDGAANNGFATVTLNAVKVNDAPTAVADTIQAVEDGGRIVVQAATLLANDTDPDSGDSKQLTSVRPSATTGSVGLDQNGNVNYTPNAAFQSLDDGETGQDTFTYTMRDGAGLTSSATVTVQVAGRNDRPVAGDDAAALAEGGEVSGDVLANDLDVDVETITVTAVDGTAGNVGQVLTGDYGTLTLGADGRYSYAANVEAANALSLGVQRSDSFTYLVSDGDLTDEATLAFTVTGVNDGVQAENDAATAQENGSVAGAVLANDSDVDADDVLTVTMVGETAVPAGGGATVTGTYGTLTLNSDGGYTYDADLAAAENLIAGENPTDVFTYTVTDSRGSTVSATLTLTVTGADERLVGDVADNTLVGGRGHDTLLGDEGHDDLRGGAGDDTVTGGGGNDRVDGGAGDDVAVFSGERADYRVDELAGGVMRLIDLRDDFADGLDRVRNVESFRFADRTVSVADIANDPVSMAPTAAFVMAENETEVGQVFADDQDANARFTFSLSGEDASLFAINQEGRITALQAPDFESPGDVDRDGVYEFDVVVNDGVSSDSQAVTVSVTDTQAPAITSGPAFSAAENQLLAGQVEAQAEGDDAALTYALSGGDADLFTVDGTGAIRFKAAPDFEGLGEDRIFAFDLTVREGAATATQAVTVTVTDANDRPIITSGPSLTAAENQRAVGRVVAADQDAGATLTYAIANGDAARFSIDENGVISFRETPNFEAGDAELRLDVIVSDGLAADTQSLTVTLTDVNDAPRAVNDTAIAQEDGGQVVIAASRLLGNDTDEDAGDAKTLVSVSSAGTVGSVFVNGNGDVVYDPGSNFQYLNRGETASDSFAYTMRDRAGAESTATVTVSIAGMNEPGQTTEPGQTIVGDAEANLLVGGGGRDALYGLGGDDTLSGGLEVDQLWGGEGTDTATYAGLSGAVYANLRGGASYVGGALADTMNSIENLIGGSGDDKLIGDGGSNVLNGGAGNDALYGLDGNDVLIGGSVEGGINQLWGGEGSDTASYAGMTAETVVDLRGQYGRVGGALVDRMNSIENVVGGSGQDRLTGEDGSNVIEGGGARDILYGLGGADTFVYRAASDSRVSSGYDTIADFQTGIDKLDLEALGITESDVRVVSGARSTSLYADTDAASAGYELAISFLGADAIDKNVDIIF